MGSPTRATIQPKSRLSLSAYEKGIIEGDRIVLSRAITLVESQLESDQQLGEQLIQNLLPYSGKSIRLGITGIPGVGKSTFIETLGKTLTSLGKKVAVLAIDPSSQRTKGSILGDKTRMDNLSRDKNAFIRPTSAGHALGGVADKTREAILLCEATGFDVVIIETVGVGQSEIRVRGMVDFFMLLLLGGAGDELQGIKKGIMEMADGIVITKADGDSIKRAKQAQADFKHALHLFPAHPSGWVPKVLITSAIDGSGINETWKMVEDFHKFTVENNFFETQRKTQNLEWFQSSIENRLKHELLQSAFLKQKMTLLEREIRSGEKTPGKASRDLVNEFFKYIANHKT